MGSKLLKNVGFPLKITIIVGVYILEKQMIPFLFFKKKKLKWLTINYYYFTIDKYIMKLAYQLVLTIQF